MKFWGTNMTEKFSFDHMDPTEFENFCYDLLEELGFNNLDWRKGTGKLASPSDSGRDIEGVLEKEDIDGTKHFEKWFVDAKCYTAGVPPKAIDSVLAWAQAENPDVVLIIASNFLSNPSKDYLKTYAEERRPHFKIKYWEKPDLEKFTLSKLSLLKRYEIPNPNLPFLKLMHRAHLRYIADKPKVSLGFFFNILDKLDPEKRDYLMEMCYYAVIKPTYIDPRTSKRMDPKKVTDQVSYEEFKRKIIYLSHEVEPYFLLFSILSFVLDNLFSMGDMTSDESIQFFKSQIEYLEKLKTGEEVLDESELSLYGIDKDNMEESCDSKIKFLNKEMGEIPKRKKKWHELYIFFCNHVISELFLDI